MRLLEIRRRDGLARSGRYTAGERTIEVPSAIDPAALFAGLDDGLYANVPLAADAGFVHRYAQQYSDCIIAHPAGAAEVQSGDCILLANWHTALANPREYIRWLIALKRHHPPDAVWYAPSCALPSNAAFLVYCGLDLFDYNAVDLCTAKHLFCTTDGCFPAAEWMDSGVCSCEGCRSGSLSMHNRTALENEISVIRRFIIAGQLRELVEARCRSDAAQVSVIRMLDQDYSFAEAYLPAARAVPMKANSAESLTRPEVLRFMQRVLERFEPTRTDTVVLLPCSARKPYSGSQSHRRFASAVQGRAAELIVTSPLGLVPRELERVYPAAHYDVPVTGVWDREEQAVIADLLARYLGKHQYRRVIAHLHGDALDIAQAAADACGITLECTVNGSPTAGASIAALDKALEGEQAISYDMVRGVASWQFGTVPETRSLVIKRRQGTLVVLNKKQQLFSIDPGTGLLRPTFDGWRRLGEVYRVEIDDFVPQGDVLAPGIVTADPAIREGDEVFIHGPQALATGRAVMGAAEMTAAHRGVAVKVRKVQKMSSS